MWAVLLRPRSIKKLSGGIRTALAQYRELAAFSQFSSDLDDATRKQLDHGQKVTELMKQKRYAPMSVAEQAWYCSPPRRVISPMSTDFENRHFQKTALLSRQ